MKRDEIREAEDYRLDYRLNKECDMDIDVLCGDVCSPFQGQACGGVVIKCLRDSQVRGPERRGNEQGPF